MNRGLAALLAAVPLLLSACAATGGAVGSQDEGLPTQSLMLASGLRAIHTSHGGDVGASVGLDYASRGDESLGWEAGLSYSNHEEFLSFVEDEDIDVFEVSAGARLTYLGFAGNRSGLLPYASAGLAGLALSGRESDEGAVGAYARGGLNYVFGGGFTAGVDLKGLVSTSDYLDYHMQLALQLGWSF